MGKRIVHICDRCQRQVEEEMEGYAEWRIITQAWLDGDIVSREGITLCPPCLEEIGLNDLFYPPEEE